MLIEGVWPLCPTGTKIIVIHVCSHAFSLTLLRYMTARNSTNIKDSFISHIYSYVGPQREGDIEKRQWLQCKFNSHQVCVLTDSLMILKHYNFKRLQLTDIIRTSNQH